nr:hypothetical protein [Pseudomonas syringae pv. actinidiae]
MAALIPKSVSVPLPALLITVFSIGLVIGIVAGVAAYSYGANKAQEEARIERAANPAHAVGDFCPPLLPPTR